MSRLSRSSPRKRDSDEFQTPHRPGWIPVCAGLSGAWGRPALLPRDPGLVDHVVPFLNVTSEARQHFGRRAGMGFHAHLGKLLFNVRHRQHLMYRLVQGIDDILWRALGCADSIPGNHFITLDPSLIDRRYS